MRPALTSSGTTALILLALCALPGGAQTAPSAPVRTPAEVLFLANAAAGPVARDRGQLLGYVSDPQGRPQPGAVVEVRSEGLRKAPLRSLTTSAGLFQLSGLDPGTYYVQVGKG
ncbi:MAG TPA: carboxypeptidase-like regulatory domain-containing protein, partial [Terriglobales bacterium]